MEPPPSDDLPQDRQESSPYILIDTRSDEIRLVDIRPGEFNDPIELDLHTASLRDCPQYDALSYVWNPLYGMSGNAIDPVTVKNSGDCIVLVGENLDAAIRHLRQPTESRKMWIDAISINQ
jgi:hypothetical protein